MTGQVVNAELAEVREELRRVDAKARDLLVVTGLAVTVGAALSGLLRTPPPVPVEVCFALAIGPWFTAVIQLLLVVRPLLVPYSLGAFADPHRAEAIRDLPLTEWRRQRWTALADVASIKYRRLRRSVDLLLGMLVLLLASSLLWLVMVLAS